MILRDHLDFIGDIHGHYDCLVNLLKKLGYVECEEGFKHPEGRQVVFLGDYIDRGPKCRDVYHLVRKMHESGNAVALLGNHEFNALAFWTRRRKPSTAGEIYYREHSFNKVMIHAETVSSFRPDGTFNGKREFAEMLEFFRTLPLYLDTPQFRAMHATADLNALKMLKAAGIWNLQDDDVLHAALDEENEDVFPYVDVILKGPEMELPEGVSFRDSENVKRFKTRLCWWVNPWTAKLQDLSLQPGITLPDVPVPEELRIRPFYSEEEVPVFFGHYWLEGEVKLYRNNVCCLDYSVASRFKHGKLVAYRFDGERKLSNEKFAVFDPRA